MFAQTRVKYNAGLSQDIQTYIANGSYTIPAGKILLGIKVEPVADTDPFRVGTAAGLGDLVPDMPIAAATGEWIQLNINAKVATTIYFSDITSSTQITFYKI